MWRSFATERNQRHTAFGVFNLRREDMLGGEAVADRGGHVAVLGGLLGDRRHVAPIAPLPATTMDHDDGRHGMIEALGRGEVQFQLFASGVAVDDVRLVVDFRLGGGDGNRDRDGGSKRKNAWPHQPAQD